MNVTNLINIFPRRNTSIVTFADFSTVNVAGIKSVVNLLQNPQLKQHGFAERAAAEDFYHIWTLRESPHTQCFFFLSIRSFFMGAKLSFQ